MASNVYARTYGVDRDGRLIPKPYSAGGRKKRRGILDDQHLGTAVAIRWPFKPDELVGIFIHSKREEEIDAIETFAKEVGITYLPPGASFGSYERGDVKEEMSLFEHQAVRVKEFEMVSAGPGGVTFRRRVMASEGFFCPVCSEYYKSKKPRQCKICGHNMSRKKASPRQILKWKKTLVDMSIVDRTYKGLTYKDYLMFTQPTKLLYSHDELVNAYIRLFPKISIPHGHGPVWMQMMVGYELHRRLAYPRGEPDKVKRIRLRLRKGILPEWAKEQCEKAKEEKKMAKKSDTGKKKATGKTARILAFGHPVTSVLRAMGQQGYKAAECYAYLTKKGIKVSPTTCSIQTSKNKRKEAWIPKLSKVEWDDIKKFVNKFRADKEKNKGKSKPTTKKVSKKKAPVKKTAKKKSPPKKKAPLKKKAKKKKR